MPPHSHIHRFGVGLKEREQQRQTAEENARQEAGNRQRGANDDLTVDELKTLIQRRTGKRPRFTSKEQLLDILWRIDQEDAAKECMWGKGFLDLNIQQSWYTTHSFFIIQTRF